MTIPVLRITAQIHGEGLKNARKILDDSVVGGLNGVGKLLTQAVQGRMRVRTGNEQRSVKARVSGKPIDRTLTVSSDLVQAFIDEMGLAPGTFPPWDVGTLLFQWVKGRKLREHTPVGEQHGVKNKTRISRPERGLAHVRQSDNSRRGRQYRQARVKDLRRPLARRSKAQRATLAKNAKRRLRDNSTRRVAFLVARAIYERGIKPGQPFAKTFQANKVRIMREVQNAFTRAVRRINTT